MIENKKNSNNSIIPIVSNGLARIEKSIAITEKIIKEQDDRHYVLSWSLLFEHKDFFNQFFSTFYSFPEAQLIEFYGKLMVGSPYIDLGDAYCLNLNTEFGLIFNKNINWTEKLKMIYYEEPSLLWNGGSMEVYSYDIKFDELPLDIIEELERLKSIYQNQIISGYGYSDEDGYYDSLDNELNNLEKYFNNVLFRRDFSNEVILKIISTNRINYFGNEIFCESLINKINKDICDFNIEGFYSNIKI